VLVEVDLSYSDIPYFIVVALIECKFGFVFNFLGFPWCTIEGCLGLFLNLYGSYWCCISIDFLPYQLSIGCANPDFI
jgi:hypothetical protein